MVLYGTTVAGREVELRSLVSGKVESDDTDVRYLHRGIAGRAFERRIELADHIQVEAGRLENGLLIIDLKQI